MLFRRMSMIVGLMALTLGNPPVLAQSNNPSNFPSTPEPMMMGQMPGGGQGMDGEMGGPGGRMLEQLDLSDTQKQQMQDIRDSYQDRIEPLQERLRTQQDELRDLMAGNASDSEIRTKHNEVLSLRQELGNLHFESMLEVRNVLTESQRAEMAELMENRRGQGGPGIGQNNNPQGQGRPNRNGNRPQR